MSIDPRPALERGLAGHYRIERQLGRGGMATVYLAQDLRHDRPVALKVLHPELALSLGTERFLREIRVAAKLQHPHILTVHDSGEVGGSEGGPELLWFTMPFVEGESLRDRLTRDRQLPIADAITIVREAAEALGYAHQHGIVHRDIKPENLLLTGEHTLVADFGIARALRGDEPQLTSTGLSVGTPAYMSPEQATGGQELDARSDVYALGCVLYELLAGEPPYNGPTPMAIMARALTEPYRPLHSIRDTVPAAVERVVATALARSPADRFKDAGEMARALTQVVTSPAGVPSVAMPAAPAAARRLFAGRPLFAALIVGVLIGGGLLFGWSRHKRATPSGLRLAVLPFENQGAKDDGYFTSGITDEIRGKLTTLHGLRVTARSSSDGYADRAGHSLQEIGSELGVDYLLTGTVRWEKAPDGSSRVKVSPELIRVSSGDAEWQRSFDAELTGVFQVQADIAQRVAEALGLAMGQQEREELAERPTASVEAYDAYLRGRDLERRAQLNVQPELLGLAQGQYERAIAADSGFGQAWARLSRVYLWLRDREPGNAQLATLARQARDRASKLIPTAPEAFLAQASFAVNAENDVPGAIRIYTNGLVQHPGDPELLTGLSYQLYGTGQIDSALVLMEKSSALDPRSPEGALGLAQAYYAVRRWPQSDSAYVRAIALAPEQYHAYFERAQIQMLWRGDTVAARKIMQTAEERIGRAEFVRKMCVACFDWTGPLAAEYERVLDQLSLKGFSSRDSANYYGARADRAFMRGDVATNRVYADSALRVIRPVLKANPKLRWAMFSLAYNSACLGDSAAARKAMVSAFQRTLEIGDTVAVRAWFADNWGWVLTRLGQREAAAESLRVAVSEPRYPYLTAKALSVSPYYARLRGVPTFDHLIAGP